MDVHLKKDDVIIASYSNFVRKDTKKFKPGIYSFEYCIDFPDIKSGRYTMDLFFTEPFVSWFAMSQNAIELNIDNANHHIFLNTSRLKWGYILLNGTFAVENIS
jgi:hypothetical protein